jgi:crotonobetainyl-CoA:carnitine CoA-transferase CaiB-like acyl-CoA transferase
VIKVESIAHPDGMRFLGGFAGASYWERSMVFAGANPSKRDVTLDLDSDDGRALLWRLIDDADVVIENFTPRVLERFGIVWPDVHVRCPRLILVRMPAFGLDGPWRDRAGFAMTIEQTSGLAWTTGYEDLPLVPRGPCDPVGGMHTIIGLLGALEDRRRSGLGQLLEVPLVDGALNMAAEQVLEFERTGEVLGRHGNRGPHAAPQGNYPAAGDDRWLTVSVATDEQWARLAPVIGMATDPGLDALAGRRARHDEIDAAITAWTSTRTAEEGADQLRRAGVPAAEVTPAQLAHLNPQYEHRRYLQRFDHPVTGTTGYPGFPMTFSALGPDLFRSRPPLLGEHNAEVLSSLGLSEAEIADLAARRVIGTRPAWVTDPD